MNHIKPLTSLRFVFALLVFLHHTTNILPKDEGILRTFYDKFFFEGFIGVNFFFILSGFILAYVYQYKFKENRISNRSFYLRRFARIYPLHFLLLIVSLPFSFDVFQENLALWLSTFAENVFLVQSFVPISDHYFSFNLVSWSISNELFFYAVFPFIIIPLSRLKKKTAIGAIIITSVVLSYGMHLVPNKLSHAVFYINPLIRLADFAIGILLFNVSINFRFKSVRNATFGEFAVALFIIVQFLLANKIPLVYRFSIYYWLSISLLIVFFSKAQGLLSSLLSGKVFVYLGNISFGFYLTHYLIIKVVKKSFNYIDILQNPILQIVASFVLTIIISILSFELFEKKVHEKILEKFKIS